MMAWNSVIGQQHVKQLLIAALHQRRLSHAYLLSGPDGVGKDACAIELAKVLNCETGGSEACDHCPDCLKFQTLQHPNVNLIFALPVGRGEESGDSPTQKLTSEEIDLLHTQLRMKADNPYHLISMPRANAIKVNSVREIRRLSSMTKFGRGKKVFIITGAELMKAEASNALLKTLEEPHEDTLIILTTARPDDLLSTIRSRCQQIRFDRLEDEEISHALREREKCDPDRASLIARLSNGNYARSLELLLTKTDERRDAAIEFLRNALYRSRQELLRSIDEIVTGAERHEIEEFLNLLMTWLRDAMLIRENPDEIINCDTEVALRKFADHHPSVDYDEAFRTIERSVLLLNKNVYIHLILLNLALQLRRIIIPPERSLKVVPSKTM